MMKRCVFFDAGTKYYLRSTSYLKNFPFYYVYVYVFENYCVHVKQLTQKVEDVACKMKFETHQHVATSNIQSIIPSTAMR